MVSALKDHRGTAKLLLIPPLSLISKGNFIANPVFMALSVTTSAGTKSRFALNTMSIVPFQHPTHRLFIHALVPLWPSIVGDQVTITKPLADYSCNKTFHLIFSIGVASVVLACKFRYITIKMVLRKLDGEQSCAPLYRRPETLHAINVHHFPHTFPNPMDALMYPVNVYVPPSCLAPSWQQSCSPHDPCTPATITLPTPLHLALSFLSSCLFFSKPPRHVSSASTSP